MAQTIDLMTYKAKIELDDSGFNTGINKAESGFDKFKSKLGGVGSVIGKTLVTGLATAGTALTAFGIKGINLASDLNEVQNVVDTTFGDGAGRINEWAKSASTAFGMSELQAKKFNGTMGSMLKSMGLSSEETLNMSQSITGLAGDFASFYNLDTEDAFNKIRSGISGETEPLKQLGINMSVANLSAFALSQGINKSYDSMTQAEQATLRYNYLMSVSADAQGDFAKTSDSFANQLRIAKLNVDDLGASLGQTLLPTANLALSGLVNFANGSKDSLNNIFQGFNGMLTNSQNGATQFSLGFDTLLSSILQKTTDIAPQLINIVLVMLTTLTTTLLNNTPLLLDTAINLFLQLTNGLVASAPQLFQAGTTAILGLISTLLTNTNSIIDTGISLLMALVNGIIASIPQLINQAPIIIQQLVDAIVVNLPKILNAGVDILMQLIQGISSGDFQLGNVCGQIIVTLVHGIINLIPQLWDVGKNIVSGLWQGVKAQKDWLYDQFKGFFGGAIDSIKKLLGIHSPSRVFAGIGEYSAQGFGVGFTDAMNNVKKDINKSIPTEIGTDILINSSPYSLSKANTMPTNSNVNKNYANSSNISFGDIVINGNVDNSTLKEIKTVHKQWKKELLEELQKSQRFSGYTKNVKFNL